MIASEVQRTLVKSPPELWAELSDPDSLARHLGQLGDIEITRVQPEELVEWRTADATGTVRIKPSGWGTKVTLTVSKELPEPCGETDEPLARAAAPEADEPAAELAGEPEPAGDDEPEAASAGEEDAAAEPEATAPTVPSAEALEPAPEQPSVERPRPRRGLFARLFGRKRPPEPMPEPPEDEAASRPQAPPEVLEPVADPAAVATADEPESDQAPADPVVVADASDPEAPSLRSQLEPEEAPTEADLPDEEVASTAQDVAAELRAAEEVEAEEVRAVLTAVLDRLGAAHHRPFSRA